jgi:hypothetical protein
MGAEEGSESVNEELGRSRLDDRARVPDGKSGRVASMSKFMLRWVPC